MIDRNKLKRIQNGVCAVGFLNGSPGDFVKNPFSDVFQIFGTGFLFDPTHILTCRHVIEEIIKQRGKDFADGLGTLFLDLEASRPVFVAASQVQVVTGTSPDWDVAVLEIVTDQVPTFSKKFGHLTTISRSPLDLGQPVATLGYLLGNEFMNPVANSQNRRLGPLLLQGHLSGIAPVHSLPPERYEELLLNLVSERCMSGAPVFKPDSGDVIGMIHGNVDYTKTTKVPPEGLTLEGSFGAQPMPGFNQRVHRPIWHPLGLAQAVPVSTEHLAAWSKSYSAP